MSNRLFALLLITAGIITYIIFLSEPTTDEIWKVRLSGEITTPPAAVDGKMFCLIRQKKLSAIDSKGVKFGPIDIPIPARHPLVGLASGVLVADRAGCYTFFNSNLKEVWKRATLTPSDIQPLPIVKNRVVISGAHEVLFALDASNGDPVWESHFEGRVVHLAATGTIAVVYGYDDLKKSDWKLCAIDAEDGFQLWTYKGSVAANAPVVYDNYFIFCDATGRPIIADATTGEVVHRHETDGYKIACVTGHFLLLLANGGTRLDCNDLATGKSWSVTLPSPFLAAHAVGEDLLFADGRSIKCLNAATGEIRWQRDLGKTFDSFVHRDALGIVYKDNFLAREVKVTLFTAKQDKILWSAADSGKFYKPMACSTGDLVVSRSGTIRLMPLPAWKLENESISSEAIKLPINTGFWKIAPNIKPTRQSSFGASQTTR